MKNRGAARSRTSRPLLEAVPYGVLWRKLAPREPIGNPDANELPIAWMVAIRDALRSTSPLAD